jgi:hypothetical protein
MDAALALDRLEQDAAGALVDLGGERARVVQLGEANAGEERLEGGALRGLAGDGERPERPPVEGAVERDDPGSPGRLPRVLERGLDRLRAGVAEERLSAAEASREARRELRRGLRPIEVGDVPQPLELRLGGGERRRVEVPEADDGDPADEVEVAAAAVVDEPWAVPGDEGDVLPRVGGEDRGGQNRCAQGRTS